MKALFMIAGTVPLSRVLREQQRWLIPLTAIIVIDIGVLVGVVLPMSQSVDAGERRGTAATQALAAATADFKDAQATRDGQAQATADLDTFYRQVLPTDVATARRITHVKLSQKARTHNVSYGRSQASIEEVKDSRLDRLLMSYELAGNWDAIRQFIYEIETGQEFIVIDNVVLAETADSGAPLSLRLQVSTYFRSEGDGR
ncbi:MAG: GspMb/PilO family protein [Vicinamibacterales bacterium]